MSILDTNVVSELFRLRPDPGVDAWLENSDPRELFVTAITKAEILVGLARMLEGRRRATLHIVMYSFFETRLVTPILPFDSAAAEYYAEIVADRSRLGQPIGPFDAQIAAIAKSKGHAIVTRNVRDFEDCGVEIVNPWRPA